MSERSYEIAGAIVKISGGRHFSGPYGEMLASYDAYVEIPGQSKLFFMPISVSASSVHLEFVGPAGEHAAAFNRLAYRLYHRVDLPPFVSAWRDSEATGDALLKATNGKVANW